MENQVLPPQRAKLLGEAKAAPTEPGVYLMKDAAGVILYIGKAKSLRARVSSYFQRIPHEIPRIDLLVSRIEKFDLILTETESEALILECTLIKKHRPKFNIRLKDDKAYPYLKLQMGSPFPRIEWTRKVRKDGARYFGPFPSGWAAKQILILLTETFKLRQCSDNTFKHRSRPCILYQMDKCTAPCVKLIGENEYKETLEQVIRVLEGKSDVLEKELQRGMADAAEREEYEEAAFYRDQLANLSIVTATQVVDEAGSQRHRDVVAVERDGTDAHAAILQVRGGRLVAVKHMTLQNVDDGLTDTGLTADFLAQYYLEQRKRFDALEPNAELPIAQQVEANEILMKEAPDDLTLLERTLHLTVKVPETDVERQLVSVAHTNARHALEQAKKNSGGHGLAALEEVQEKLHLANLPVRIECYDNSNIQGEDAVASRVVFIDGAPDKNLYRRYKIRTVEGANDFATMREVLGRRFSNREEPLPDLVVVDGGKGQLSQAVAIMEELNIQGVAVVGLAKARVESDFQSAEVQSSMERIFIPNRKNPIPLLPHTQGYKLLTHIRDEAHRFAINYHRLLRDKKSLKSEF